MRFGILGPTQVRRSDGREVAVGGSRLRTLLALLLVDPGKVITAGRLIDGLYGGNPPGDAANALQSQVSRLRHLLRDEDRPGPPVELHPAGYRLAVEADEVDAHRFERLAVEGRRALAAGDHPRAARLLREALDLWRGPALVDAGLIFQAIDHPRIYFALPLSAFLFLVALGVDYTIFLMTRAREEAGRLGHRRGVLHALTVTGGVITSAGLVLAATFASLGVLPLVPSLQTGLIVAVGVLLDTLIVRSLLIPALAIDIGPRVWWPSRLAARHVQPPPPAVTPAEPIRVR